MNNLIGTTIDHYQILAQIRETPTRVLYKAYNTRSHNYIALEVIKTSGPEPSELLSLINEQMRRNAELTHPNIATIIDTGLFEGLTYIVYNFCPAHLLRRFFNRTYSWQESSRELVALTHALAYAHEKGIIHGAFHPSSIVLDERRNPILFDFGFEQIITNYILAYSPGAWINRWGYQYRAPEQLKGGLPNAQTEIYALGMMLYEWLNGKIPLLDSTILGTLQMRKTDSVAADKKSTILPVIQNLIQKCISSDPADRYQSMQEVYIVLARGALDMSITRKMVRKPLEIPQKRFNAMPLIRRFGFSVLMLSIAAAAIFFMSKTGWFPSQTSASTVTALPSSTNIPVTLTRTAGPTSTPTLEGLITEAPPPVLSFPVFQQTPISSAVEQTISNSNINQIIMLSILGIGDVDGLVASPNGSYIAVASSIGIFIFDAQNLNLEKHIDTRSWITAMDFSPDSEILATGDRYGLIQLWSTSSWEEAQAPYSGHTKEILDMAFSPDGTKLASVSFDNTLIQWNVNPTVDPKSLRTALISVANAVAYSADNTRIVTGGNDLLLNIWDASNLTFLQKKDFTAQVVDIAALEGSNSFVIGGNDQRVVMLDISGEPILKSVGQVRYPLTHVAASPDGKLIAAADLNGGVAIWEIDGQRINDIASPKSYVVETLADPDSPGSPHSLVFSADGTRIYSGLRNGVIRSLNSTTGIEVQTNLSFNAHVKKLAVSNNSQLMIVQQDNDTLTVWNLKQGIPLYQLLGEIKEGDPFSQDDTKFAVASISPGPATINIYDATDGSEIHTLRSQRDLYTIQFINDSAQLVAVYEGFVNLWAMSSGQQLETKPVFDGTGCQAITDKDEHNVASITNHHHVVENDLNKPGICTFDPGNWKTAINESEGFVVYGGGSRLTLSKFRGGEDENMRGVNLKNIVSVAISPNGDLVAAAFDDYTIHIWDAETRDELTGFYGLYGHNNSITALHFTSDGKLLISTSLDGTVRLWGVPY